MVDCSVDMNRNISNISTSSTTSITNGVGGSSYMYVMLNLVLKTHLVFHSTGQLWLDRGVGCPGSAPLGSSTAGSLGGGGSGGGDHDMVGDDAVTAFLTQTKIPFLSASSVSVRTYKVVKNVLLLQGRGVVLWLIAL